MQSSSKPSTGTKGAQPRTSPSGASTPLSTTARDPRASLRGMPLDAQLAALTPEGSSGPSPAASSSSSGGIAATSATHAASSSAAGPSDVTRGKRVDQRFVSRKLLEIQQVRQTAWDLVEEGSRPEEVTQYVSSRAVEWLEEILIAARADYGQALPDFAMVALGSLTRGEMSPESDIDLCFLAAREHHDQLAVFRDHLRTQVLPLFSRQRGGLQTDFEGGVEGMATPEQLGAGSNKGRDLVPLAVTGGDRVISASEQGQLDRTNQVFDKSRGSAGLIEAARQWADNIELSVRRMDRGAPLNVKSLLRTMSMSMSVLAQHRFATGDQGPSTTPDRMRAMARSRDPLANALNKSDRATRTTLLQRLQSYYSIVLGWRLETDRKNPGGVGQESARDRDDMIPTPAQAEVVRAMHRDLMQVVAALTKMR
ncbi:MAG: nucleotidyltransferase domain-containing protein [Deltaproteobacteria bacterium]|nr:nucleotidyltransferase domain-containing protein [Deltaproteobacteria bacterium]